MRRTWMWCVWGTLLRLHCHPHKNGSMAAKFEEVGQPLAPATDESSRRRGKGPGRGAGSGLPTGFLVGGQDDAAFLAAASERRLQGWDRGLRYWPRDPLEAHGLQVLVGNDSHNPESHNPESHSIESHNPESHNIESHEHLNHTTSD